MRQLGEKKIIFGVVSTIPDYILVHMIHFLILVSEYCNCGSAKLLKNAPVWLSIMITVKGNHGKWVYIKAGCYINHNTFLERSERGSFHSQ